MILIFSTTIYGCWSLQRLHVLLHCAFAPWRMQCLVVWHQSANDSCYFTMICVLCRTTGTWQFGTISCWLLATSRLYVLLHYAFASWRVRCLVVWHQSANDVLVSLHDLCALSYYQYLAVWHYFCISCCPCCCSPRGLYVLLHFAFASVLGSLASICR